MPPCCPPVLYLLLFLWQGLFDVLRCHSRDEGVSCLQSRCPLSGTHDGPRDTSVAMGILSWFRWVAGCSPSSTQEADDSPVHSEGMEGGNQGWESRWEEELTAQIPKRGDNSLWNSVFHWKEHSIDCPIPCWAFSTDNKAINGWQRKHLFASWCERDQAPLMWVPQSFPPWFCLSGRQWVFKQMPTTPYSTGSRVPSALRRGLFCKCWSRVALTAFLLYSSPKIINPWSTVCVCVCIHTHT